MIRKLTLVAAVMLVAVASAPSSWAQPDLQVDFLYEAEADLEVHAGEVEQALVVNVDRAEPHLCAVYGNNLPGKQRNKGAIIADFEILRLDPETGEPFVDAETGKPIIEELRLRGQVRDGVFLECQPIDPLNSGDIVHVEYNFKKMPRLREASDGSQGAFRVVSVLSEEAKEVEDFLEPDQTELCSGTDGGGDGGGGDGGGGGGTSGSDGAAVERARGCAGGGVGVQFRWEGGRMYFDRRDAGGSISSLGPFAGYAAAGDAAANTFQCSPGVGVSSADAAELPRLNAWGSAGGGRLLALRFESNGGSQVYVDAYSSAIGEQHGSPHGSIAGAIRAFCASFGC